MKRPGSGNLEELFFPGNLVTEMGQARKRQNRQGRQVLTARAAEEAYQARFGMFLDGWYQNTVPGNQTAIALNRWSSASFLSTAYFARDGHVSWLQAALDAPLTAGTVIVEVWINSLASGFTVELNTDEPTVAEETGGSEFAFAAGEPVRLRVTSSGFAPTTANLLAMIGVLLE